MAMVEIDSLVLETLKQELESRGSRIEDLERDYEFLEKNTVTLEDYEEMECGLQSQIDSLEEELSDARFRISMLEDELEYLRSQLESSAE